MFTMPFSPLVDVSIREYLRTGEFGPIRLGDSAEKLRSILGEPHSFGGALGRRRTPGIWKYGDIEFHLTDDRQRVGLIFCDTFVRLNLGAAASLDSWFFEGHPPYEAVERELSAATIGFHRQDMLHEPTGYLLHLESGVQLLFSTGGDPLMWPGCPGLFGFQHAGK